MTFPVLKRYFVLGVLSIFISYFGVYVLYQEMVAILHPILAMAIAAFATLGLGIIIVVGLIMIRTKSLLEASGKAHSCDFKYQE